MTAAGGITAAQDWALLVQHGSVASFTDLFIAPQIIYKARQSDPTLKCLYPLAGMFGTVTTVRKLVFLMLSQVLLLELGSRHSHSCIIKQYSVYHHPYSHVTIKTLCIKYCVITMVLHIYQVHVRQ